MSDDLVEKVGEGTAIVGAGRKQDRFSCGYTSYTADFGTDGRYLRHLEGAFI